MSVLLFIFNFAFASFHPHSIPDLEAPSWQYPAKAHTFSATYLTVHPWQGVLSVGPRNLQWLQVLNSQLSVGQKIDWYPMGEAKGSPIEEPLLYNDTFLNEWWAELAQMPPEMHAVLLQDQDFPLQIPVDFDTYKTWAKKTDRLYSMALRWQMAQQYLDYYGERRTADVRGFYYIRKLQQEGGTTTLAQLRSWVATVCMNATGSVQTCENEAQAAANERALMRMFERYKTEAQMHWDYFFQVENPRSDVSVVGGGMAMPFRRHQDSAINIFVESNVEDEFKWAGGFLDLTITPGARANVKFMPAVTPHVDGLGGDNIVMNSENPLNSWSTEYTIRHEFGHVLGLPDCYVEFWDANERVMVSYQIDTTNLMCSRAGRFNTTNEEALRKAYNF